MKKICICLALIILLLSITGCSDDTDYAVDIQKDIKSLEYSDYGTNYAIGKVISTRCTEVESDGYGRYLYECKIKYNPKLNSGATDLTKELDENVYAMFMNISSSRYARLYGSKTMEDYLKSEFCWGKPASDGYDC